MTLSRTLAIKPWNSPHGLVSDVKKWPTPMKEDSHCPGNSENGRRTLHGDVKLWTTPQAHDVTSTRSDELLDEARKRSGAGRHDLTTDVPHCLACMFRSGESLTTPRADEHKDSGDPDSHSHMLSRGYLCAQVKVAGEQLNPAWEELLMGWPIGWTDVLNPCTGEWYGWPMGQGPEQYDFEPPRTIQRGTMTNRTKRVEMCGNGVVPQCADIAYALLMGAQV